MPLNYKYIPTTNGQGVAVNITTNELTPKILEWLRATYTRFEFNVGIREIEVTLPHVLVKIFLSSLEQEIQRLKTTERALDQAIPEDTPITKKAKKLPNSLFFTHCIKESRKLADDPRSRFFICDDNGKTKLEFEIEHDPSKAYPKGGFAERVKKGYVRGGSTPRYAIKILRKDAIPGGIEEEFRTTARSAFCLKLLGQTGEVFRHNDKQFLVMDWQVGTILSKVSSDELEKRTITERIKLALDLTTQIAILHENGIIHCDIKPDNLILSSNKLKLIDFDAARAKGEVTKSAMFTLCFLSTQQHWELHHKISNFNDTSDMYAFGLTLGFLFPELFAPEFATHTVSINSNTQFSHPAVKLNYGPKYTEHKELFDLIRLLVSLPPLRSIKDFLVRLRALYIDHYGQEFPEVEIKQTECGKTAFLNIEKEIEEYKQRSHDFVAQTIEEGFLFGMSP